mgnify:CR=1 FL=1
MLRPPFRLYFLFTAVFLIMHGTGVVAGQLPYIYNAMISFSVVLLALLVSEKWYSGKTYKKTIEDLGFHSTPFSGIVPGIIISVALLLLYPVFGYFLNTEIALHESWLPNLAGICLTGGLMEEMFFRGFLFRHLRESMTFRKAVFVSAMLFTAAHLLLFTYMDWAIALSSTLLAVFMSVPLAWLFERGGYTVWSPAILHATIRTIGLVVTTSEEHFMPLALFWMLGGMVVPYLVLLFYSD